LDERANVAENEGFLAMSLGKPEALEIAVLEGFTTGDLALPQSLPLTYDFSVPRSDPIRGGSSSSNATAMSFLQNAATMSAIAVTTCLEWPWTIRRLRHTIHVG
jgi:hypothetical protein